MANNRTNFDRHDTSQTILKTVEGNTSPRHASISDSDSGQSAASNTCSLLSNGRPFVSDSFGSSALLPTHSSSMCNQQLPPGRHIPRHINRPLPELPTSNRRKVYRTQISSSNHSSHRRRSTSTSPFLQRRCLIIIVIISLTTSILSLALAAFCFVYMFAPTYQDHTFMNGDLELCIPCHHLREDGESGSVKRQFESKNTSGGVEQCCARNSGQMSALIQNIMNRGTNITVDRPPTNQTHRPIFATAHKFLSPGSITNDEGFTPQCDSKHCHINLITENVTANEHVEMVKVQKSSIEVIISGWYFIYSSIMFKLSSEYSCDQLSNKTFKNLVMRMSANKPNQTGALYETTHTCNSNSREDLHTSYGAGVFRLEKTDRVYIEMSGSGLVDYNEDGTYIGMMLLWSTDSHQ